MWFVAELGIQSVHGCVDSVVCVDLDNKSTMVELPIVPEGKPNL